MLKILKRFQATISKLLGLMLFQSKILVTVVGNTDIDKVYNHLLGEFKNINRNYIHLPNPVFVGKSEKVNNYIEKNRR